MIFISHLKKRSPFYCASLFSFILEIKHGKSKKATYESDLCAEKDGSGNVTEKGTKSL